MNKFLQKVAKIFLGLSMAAGVGVAIGAGRKDASPVHADTISNFVSTATITSAGTNGGSGSASSANQSGITVSSDGGYFTTSQYKIYSGKKLNVSISSGTITSLSLTFSSSSYNGLDSSYTVNNSSCSYTASKQTRITNLTIVYTTGGGGATVSSVTVTPSTLALDLFSTPTGSLSATVNGTGSPAQTVTWSSSDDTKVEVDSSGNVTAKAVTTTDVTITATSTVDDTKSGTCLVSVTDSTPALPAGAVDVSTSIATYASNHSWSNGTQYTSVTLNSHLTATTNSTGNTGKYYTSGYEWRLYQTDSATLTITASKGTICRIKISYNISNSGLLLDAGGNGVASDEIVYLSNNVTSYTFNVGNSGSATNGQVKVTNIEVWYVPPTTYTVTVAVNNANYGSVNHSTITNVESGTAISVSNNTFTIGNTTVTATAAAQTVSNTYAFVEWSGVTATVLGNMTITAVFSESARKYNVTGSITNGSLTGPSKIDYGGSLNVTIVPLTNYVCPEDSSDISVVGATLASYNSGTGVVGLSNATGNVTVTATCPQDAQLITVTYDANGGSVSPTSEPVAPNGHPTFPTPTQSGYKFKGWQIGGSGQAYFEPEDYIVTQPVTFIASWVAVHTVAFNANGGSATPDSKSVETGSTFTFPAAPGTKTHHSFVGWTSTGDEPYYAAGATSPAVTGNITYTAHWTEDTHYTVSFKDGSSVLSTEEVYAGETASRPSDPTKTGYRFINWYAESTFENVFDFATTINQATEIFAKFEEKGEEYTDVINAALTGVTGTGSYSAWSNKAGTNSPAVYAGNSAKTSNSEVQLRSSNSSGIVSTTSGGYLRKVEVDWGSSLTTSRTIDVYAKTTEYDGGSADLYDSSKQGTKVGSIAYVHGDSTSTQTELSVSGSYTYFGLRSNSAAIYLDSISITWEEPTIPRLAAPVIAISNNVISWSAVSNAVSYTYSIIGDDDRIGHTTSLSLDLNNIGLVGGSYSVTVFAVGDETNYRDSNSSNSVNFTITASEQFPQGDSNAISFTKTSTVVDIDTSEYDAIKAGTGDTAGSVQFTIPSGSTGLSFRAAGWSGESVTLTLTGINDINPDSVNLRADDGITGNGATYTLVRTQKAYLHTFEFNALSSNTTLTIAATSGKRFVIWDIISYTYSAPVPAISLEAEDNNPSVDVGYTTTITATKENGATGTVTWATSDSTTLAIVTSPAQGDTITVRGVSEGTATITASLTGCSDATILITVNDPSAPTPPEGTKADWVAANQGFTSGDEVSTSTILTNYITVEFNKGSGSNAPKYYDTGSAVRAYAGNYLTITSTKANIRNIVLTFASGGGSNAVTADTGSVSADNTTWTPATGTLGTSVTLTIGGASNHRRIAEISVGYYGADEWSYEFLSNTGCDSTGVDAPSISWSSYETKYNLLFASQQNTLQTASANEHSTSNIEKAVARYDYIVGKYNPTDDDSSTYKNFIGRTVTPRSGVHLALLTFLNGKNTNTVAIIVIISMVSVTAIGGYFFLRKRKENN